jgi:hypothetical protein
MRSQLVPGDIPWITCEACEDVWCNIHRVHAGCCECPGIEDWKISPYDPVEDVSLIPEDYDWDGDEE